MGQSNQLASLPGALGQLSDANELDIRTYQLAPLPATFLLLRQLQPAFGSANQSCR